MKQPCSLEMRPCESQNEIKRTHFSKTSHHNIAVALTCTENQGDKNKVEKKKPL